MVDLNLSNVNDLCDERKIWLNDQADISGLNDYLLDMPWYLICDQNLNVDVITENFYKIFLKDFDTRKA